MQKRVFPEKLKFLKPPHSLTASFNIERSRDRISLLKHMRVRTGFDIPWINAQGLRMTHLVTRLKTETRIFGNGDANLHTFGIHSFTEYMYYIYSLTHINNICLHIKYYQDYH